MALARSLRAEETDNAKVWGKAWGIVWNHGWIAIAAPGVLSSAGLHRSGDRPTTMKKLSVHGQHLTKIVPG
jgi:hypothetical protein